MEIGYVLGFWHNGSTKWTFTCASSNNGDLVVETADYFMQHAESFCLYSCGGRLTSGMTIVEAARELAMRGRENPDDITSSNFVPIAELLTQSGESPQ